MPFALATPSPGRFIVVLVIGVLSALLVFQHANSHGSKHATAWGIAAFLFGLLVVAIYFIRYWITSSRRPRL